MLVDYQRELLNQAAADVQQSVRALIELNDRLQSRVRKLGVDWESPQGRQDWEAKQREWDSSELATREAVDMFGASVGLANDTMFQADSQVAGYF